jgi:hypothetical protein
MLASVALPALAIATWLGSWLDGSPPRPADAPPASHPVSHRKEPGVHWPPRLESAS